MKTLNLLRVFAAGAVAILLSQTAAAYEMQQGVTVLRTDESPVVGAKVFDSATNTLLGVTNADGRVVVNARAGTVLRVVEPGYGVQQASVIVGMARAELNVGRKKGDLPPGVTNITVYWEIF